MHATTTIGLLIILGLFGLTKADLKSCSENHTHLTVCFRKKNGYTEPFPVVVSTELYLNDIISLDEDDNSITFQVGLWSQWNDLGLALSKNSTKYVPKRF